MATSVPGCSASTRVRSVPPCSSTENQQLEPERTSAAMPTPFTLEWPVFALVVVIVVLMTFSCTIIARFCLDKLFREPAPRPRPADPMPWALPQVGPHFCQCQFLPPNAAYLPQERPADANVQRYHLRPDLARRPLPKAPQIRISKAYDQVSSTRLAAGASCMDVPQPLNNYLEPHQICEAQIENQGDTGTFQRLGIISDVNEAEKSALPIAAAHVQRPEEDSPGPQEEPSNVLISRRLFSNNSEHRQRSGSSEELGVTPPQANLLPEPIRFHRQAGRDRRLTQSLNIENFPNRNATFIAEADVGRYYDDNDEVFLPTAAGDGRKDSQHRPSAHLQLVTGQDAPQGLTNAAPNVFGTQSNPAQIQERVSNSELPGIENNTLMSLSTAEQLFLQSGESEFKCDRLTYDRENRPEDRDNARETDPLLGTEERNWGDPGSTMPPPESQIQVHNISMDIDEISQRDALPNSVAKSQVDKWNISTPIARHNRSRSPNTSQFQVACDRCGKVHTCLPEKSGQCTDILENSQPAITGTVRQIKRTSMYQQANTTNRAPTASSLDAVFEIRPRERPQSQRKKHSFDGLVNMSKEPDDLSPVTEILQSIGFLQGMSETEASESVTSGHIQTTNSEVSISSLEWDNRADVTVIKVPTDIEEETTSEYFSSDAYHKRTPAESVSHLSIVSHDETAAIV